MKSLIFSATVLAIAVAMVPGTYACSASTDAAGPQRTGSETGHKPVASEADIAVLVGLLLGIAIADPHPAATPCPGCADAR
jgi:hypothetical protein